jgi:hypothetical protein
VRVGSGFLTVVGVGTCPEFTVGVATGSVVSTGGGCWNGAVFANGRGGSSRVKITNKLRRDGRRETGDGLHYFFLLRLSIQFWIFFYRIHPFYSRIK